ncbi:hypothetical protein [Candidatus Pelagibacter sp. Uisw_134_02]|uniref:hypothetical protein n=1 Tax=Candidatus Pelagibacter sp. Uisw_134_02 TaxID=3230990 RepID=UPI0039E8CBA5
MSNISFIIGFVFTIGWVYGFLTKQEFKTNANLRIIIHWIMALTFFLYHEVPGTHLFYTFPLGIVLSFLGIPIMNKINPYTIKIISIIIWSFVLMTLSNIFGTFA